MRFASSPRHDFGPFPYPGYNRTSDRALQPPSPAGRCRIAGLPDMIGPHYGQWWKEGAASRRLRLAVLVVPLVLVVLAVFLASPVNNRLRAHLFDAVDRGQIDEVRRLIELGAPVTGRVAGGQTLLHRALYQEREDLALAIIDAGADVDAVDNQGVAPMHHAASIGALAVVERLLERGADPDVRSPRYGAPLHHAARHGHAAVVHRLIEAGAAVDAADARELTPLHHVILTGDRQLTALLLAHGANTEAADDRGRRPLHWAAVRGRAVLAADLIEADARLDAPDGKGNTALHHAARRGFRGVAVLLMGHGAPVDAATPHFAVTPLHYAARAGWNRMVRLLLAGGADINAGSGLYGTPLHWAAESGRIAVASTLLEHGADRMLRDDHGYRPESRARQRGHFALAALLAAGEQPPWGARRAEPLRTTTNGCGLPGRMHRVSRVFLDSYVRGDISAAEFRRRFSLPNSGLIEVGRSIAHLHAPPPALPPFWLARPRWPTGRRMLGLLRRPNLWHHRRASLQCG